MTIYHFLFYQELNMVYIMKQCPEFNKLEIVKALALHGAIRKILKPESPKRKCL